MLALNLSDNFNGASKIEINSVVVIGQSYISFLFGSKTHSTPWIWWVSQVMVDFEGQRGMIKLTNRIIKLP